MSLNRRSFLRSSTLWLCGAALAPAGAWAASPSKSKNLPTVYDVPLDAAHQAVFQWISGYSSRVRLAGGCVLGKLRGTGGSRTRILAEIDDLSALGTALTTAESFGEVFSQNNTLSFTYGGTEFTIENLLPGVFTSTLSSLANRKKVTFAHEALAYDPVSQTLSDPFGALKATTLKIVYKGAGVAGAFETLLRGWIEAATWQLEPGSGFASLKRTVLGAPGNRGGLATPVVQRFVQYAATLAEVMPTGGMEALIGSRLVSTALQKVLGLTGQQVIGQYQALRAQTAAEITDAALWLKVLLALPIQQGTADAWIAQSDRPRLRRARVALAQARTLSSGSSTSVSQFSF